ncbi:uracil-DNA glycosylase [Arcobacter sp. FWKO B]|uniref:uracil-DNA glycosylase n=1 Tax=Arcobacter sp. FWKO B TaxID=2593672 RepID=UPI0018A4F1C6|nr:uracil-DNA glycosylase [Arcobacter sp. FWKO B]QOG11273.1 uracil-DNA glycosylase [Arcobacter sp. FWKO B]
MTVNPQIEPSWKEVLSDEFEKKYFVELQNFLIEERQNYTIYPKSSDIFNAFSYTPFDDVKVVIIGQDPYHGANQAHGLAFSVLDGVTFPPSLRNIFQELHSDIGCSTPKSGNLSSWAKQGVFLINTVLSVREARAHSHAKKGWEIFTGSVIKKISEKRENIVFILWGSPAIAKSKLIDISKHHIITSPHPSPLSSYRGFFGSKPFSRTNEFLGSCGIGKIEWCL